MMWTIRDSGVPYGPATVSLSVKAMGLLRRLAYLALGLQRSLRMVMQSNSAPLLLYDWRSTSTRQAWENDRMAAVPSRMRSAQAQAVLIAFLVVTLAVSTWMAPPHAFVLHNVLHHLNILPFMLAAMFFGWRGVIKTVLLAAVLQAPSIHRHWFRAPLDAQDQIVELSTLVRRVSLPVSSPTVNGCNGCGWRPPSSN
jgi:hypothetical protein